MNIIEVKNNLIKFCYEEDLFLSGFVLIQDDTKKYIAQIIHLESSRIGKVALGKILFRYDNGFYAYDGAIPSLRSQIIQFPSETFLSHLEHSNPLTLGKLAGQKENLTIDFDILNDNPIILCEKFYLTKVLLNNFALQLQARNKKIVVFDTKGIFKNNKFSLRKDFKLPLNKSTINYIYEYGFADATAESKALIQSIFEELSEYSKTVDFIPFDTFKSVVDSEFIQTKLMQLIIMKNKLTQIREWEVFAQDKREFETIKTKLENDSTVVFDISGIKKSLQKECVKYIYSILKTINGEIYAFTPLSGESADDEILRAIYDAENIHTSVICDYDYANLNELKKISKNMIMFAPLKQQKDFGGYNVFLQRLSEDEFIIYGKTTKFIPLIGKLNLISKSDIVVPQVDVVQEVHPAEPIISEEPVPVEIAQETVEVQDEPVQVDTEPEAEETTEALTEDESVEVEDESEIENIDDVLSEDIEGEETEIEEVVRPDIEEEGTEIEEVVQPDIEEIPQPEAAVVETPEIITEEKVEAVSEGPSVEEVVKVSEEAVPEPKQDVVSEALNEVPDIEDDEELSDDDLDMIEQLSKADDEVEIINSHEAVTQTVTNVEEERTVTAETSIPEQHSEEISEQAPVSDVIQQEPETIEELNEEVVEEVPQNEENSAEEELPQEQEEIPPAPPVQAEPLQTRANTTPTVPEYSADFPDEDKVNSDTLNQGDRVFHEEFGEGVVEKTINYGDKILCSINFQTVGRRLLNPEITEMRKI